MFLGKFMWEFLEQTGFHDEIVVRLDLELFILKTVDIAELEK